MTSGGLGTMGYGLPAAVGVQTAHLGRCDRYCRPKASVQMTMQGNVHRQCQYDLPIKDLHSQ